MSGNNKIDAIFLDVGGIILQIDWLQTLNHLGILEEENQKHLLEKVRKLKILFHYERGHASRADFFDEFASIAGVQNDFVLEAAFNKLIVGPLNNADKIFDEFSGRLPIYALSNTNECHHEYQLAQFPILKRFDHFLTSFELGHRKPDPEIFIAGAEKMNVRPERAIFFDDSLANVEAAKMVGFHAFQTINAPEETLAILKRFLD